jgi:hypothetical protein
MSSPSPPLEERVGERRPYALKLSEVHSKRHVCRIAIQDDPSPERSQRYGIQSEVVEAKMLAI